MERPTTMPNRIPTIIITLCLPKPRQIRLTTIRNAIDCPRAKEVLHTLPFVDSTRCAFRQNRNIEAAQHIHRRWGESPERAEIGRILRRYSLRPIQVHRRNTIRMPECRVSDYRIRRLGINMNGLDQAIIVDLILSGGRFTIGINCP